MLRKQKKTKKDLIAPGQQATITSYAQQSSELQAAIKTYIDLAHANTDLNVQLDLAHILQTIKQTLLPSLTNSIQQLKEYTDSNQLAIITQTTNADNTFLNTLCDINVRSEILQHLSLGDIARLRQTCHALEKVWDDNMVISFNRCQIKKLAQNRPLYMGLKVIAEKLGQSNKNPLALTMADYGQYANKKQSCTIAGPELLSEINTFKKNLQFLLVSGVALKTKKSLTTLSSLTELTQLSLPYCSIENLSAISGLQKLKALCLDWNNITDITPLCSLRMLEELSFEHNDLTSLPIEISQLKKLKKLNLKHNDTLDNEALKRIGTITTLEELNLETGFWGNQITIIPDEILLLKQLKKLTLQGRPLTETMLSKLCNLTSLEELDVALTNLTNIPHEIYKLEKLKKLNLQWNRLSSESLKNIGMLTSLEELSLDSDISLTTLPKEISELKNLKKLSITRSYTAPCPITPQILQAICKMTTLEELCLDNTYLATIPDEISALVHLKRLSISHCHLTSQSFKNICTLTSLEELNLNDKYYSRDTAAAQPIPEEFKHTESLNIAANKAELRKLTHLKILDLHSNRLTIEDLAALCTLTNLEQLELGYTDLHTIPAEIFQLTHLKKLGLAGLSDITKDFDKVCAIKTLEELDLSNTSLVTLPESINQLTHVKKLNLSSSKPISKELLVKLAGLPALEELKLERSNLAVDQVTLQEILKTSPRLQRYTAGKSSHFIVLNTL